MPTPNYIEVHPAYGADYTSQKAVKQAWKDGRDFRSYTSAQVMNKQDVETFMPDAHILVRYADQRKVVQVC